MLADNRPQWNAGGVASVGEPAAKEGRDPLMQQLTDGARRMEQHHSTSLQNPTDQNEFTVKEKNTASYIQIIVSGTTVQ